MIAFVGTSGDLGFRIARSSFEVQKAGALLRRIYRRPSARDSRRLASISPATHRIGRPLRPLALARRALSLCSVRLREVMIDRQGILLATAVEAGVPRFISSNYSADMLRPRPACGLSWIGARPRPRPRIP